MKSPVIIFTKTNRANLFDNLDCLRSLDPDDHNLVIADYSPFDYYRRTKSLVLSQPKFKHCDVQHLKIDDLEGLDLLRMLGGAHQHDFICFKDRRHFCTSLVEAILLSTRSENLQSSKRCSPQVAPMPSQIFPSAIVMTEDTFWRAISRRTKSDANEKSTIRHQAAH